MSELNEIWNSITDSSDLDIVVSESMNQKVVIFKHSTRCSISRMVLRGFEEQNQENEKVKFYYLDLLNYRPISSEIGNKFDVVHQSPQLIILDGGKVIEHASHNEILNINL